MSVNFEEIPSRAHGNFEGKMLWSLPQLLSVIIINAYCNYITNKQYRYRISNKGPLKKCNKQEQVAVTVLLLLPLAVQKQTVKRSAQCDVLVRSPPDRRHNGKYPVNTSHRSDWCKIV